MKEKVTIILKRATRLSFNYTKSSGEIAPKIGLQFFLKRGNGQFEAYNFLPETNREKLVSYIDAGLVYVVDEDGEHGIL